MSQHINSLEKAIAAFSQENTVLYPAATLWGLGCLSSSKKAIKAIDEIKRRPANKSYITLVDEISRVQAYVAQLPHGFEQEVIASTRPTTYILPHAKDDFQHLSLNGSIAIRITRAQWCIELIRELKQGIVSTSANISGEPSPTSFDGIAESIVDEVDYIYTPQQLTKLSGKASRIVKYDESGELSIIRP